MDTNNSYAAERRQAVDQLVELGQYPPPVEPPKPRRWPLLLMWLLVLAAFAGLVLVIALRARQSSNGDKAAMSQKIDLNSISSGSSLFGVDANDRVIINGQLRLNNGFTISPSDEPVNPDRGQIYIDSSTGQLRYYNGAVFVTVASSSDIAGISTVIAGLGLQTPLPQNLSTTASPQFAGLNLAGSVRLGGTTIQGAPGANLAFTLPASNGVAGQCLSTDGLGNLGYVTCLTGSSPSAAFVQGGNSFGTTAALGTTDNNSLSFITNNTTRLTVSTAGNVGINNASPDNRLSVNSASTADLAAQLLVSTGAAANKGLVVQGSASQSADLFQAQTSGGANLFSIGASGTVISQSDSVAAFQIQNSAGTSNLLVADTNNSRIGINNSAPSADLSFGEGANRVINVQTRTNNTAGNNLTIQAGNAGAGGSALVGGDLILQAGNAAGTGVVSGGNVIVRTGSGVGGGTNGNFEIHDDIDQPYFRVQADWGASGIAVTCGRFLNNDCTYTAGTIGVGTMSNNLRLVTQPTNAASVSSGDITIKSGDALGASANSGTINIGSGTATGTSGGVTINNGNDTANAFRVLNQDGTRLLSVNTVNRSVSIGQTAPIGTVKFLITTTLVGQRINVTSTNDALQLQSNAVNIFTVSSTGAVLSKNTSDSTAAFEIQNTSGTPLLTADTSGMKLTVKSLVVNGSLTVNGHTITGNTSGTTTVAAGPAACTTPSISITGNDTAGKVTVTTGTSCGGPGVLATVTFANSYGAAPNVILTPTNADSTNYGYYNGASSTSSFTIDTLGAPDGTTLVYNYFVVQ